MFSFELFFFLNMFLYVFFECKCNSLKQLGENRQQNRRKHKHNIQNSKKNRKHRNTGYPALDPTANEYLSGSGWEISGLFYMFFCFS